MTKFPESLYLPEASEPQDVLMWGKSPELNESDNAEGIARIGDWRKPNYRAAYLLASRTLLDTAKKENTLDHLSLPIFFLQRHAAELMMKEPLQLAIEVHQLKERIGQEPSLDFPRGVHYKNSEESHSLDVLLSDLETMVNAFQVGKVPEPLRLAVQKMLSVEEKPSWSRYSFHTTGRKEQRFRHHHLRQEITIPLQCIQGLLEQASPEIGFIWPDDGSLMGSLGSLIEPLWHAADE
ncbi:hypothetical protein [Comamonas kerstersii]|uniref:hypothetical protein n=1 Tax=Comamonas kerstersii TaxID=225992 RepID=UPI001B31E71A|nr:hypothetical protein [Comamonas kerstersii]QTW18677.1 hypothetical protein H8N02_16230 [Comamonas kerstersii]